MSNTKQRKEARAPDLTALRWMAEFSHEELTRMGLTDAAQVADRLCGEISAALEAERSRKKAGTPPAVRPDPRLNAPVGSA